MSALNTTDEEIYRQCFSCAQSGEKHIDYGRKDRK